MRWLLYPLAVIAALAVIVAFAVGLLAIAAHRGQRRRQRSWQDRHVLQVEREQGPLVVADNPSLWVSYVHAHDLHAPRRWRP